MLVWMIVLIFDALVVFREFDWIEILFFLIGLIAIWGIRDAMRLQAVSFYHIHWFFVFVFLFMIPTIQYHQERFLFLHALTNKESILYANLVILVWIIFYAIMYRWSYFHSKYTIIIRHNTKKFPLQRLQWSVGIAILFTIGIIVFVDFDIFIYRGYLYKAIGQMFGLVFANYIRPLLFFIWLLVTLELYINRSKKLLLIWIILFGLMLLYNFPLAQPRFYLFALVSAVFVWLVSFKRYSGYVLYLYLGFALFGSMLFEMVRRLKTTGFEGAFQKGIISIDYFFKGHFDAYEMLVMTIKSVFETSVTYGHNLLSSVLFFVPRGLWSSKDSGTGHYLVDHFMSRHYLVINDNLSCPLMAEFFLNFHFFGVALGAILYGYVTATLDQNYLFHTSKNLNKQSTVFIFGYGFLIGMFLLHLRGDMMSSLAYISGGIVAYLSSLFLLNYSIDFSKRSPLEDQCPCSDIHLSKR